MKSVATDRKDPFVDAVIRAAFPDYRGRTVRLHVADRVELVGTFWDGGSRSRYALVSLTDPPRMAPLPQYDPPQFGGPRRAPMVELDDPRKAVVEHAIFCGKDAGITIHARADALTPYLPTEAPLSEVEGWVLSVHVRLNSRGRKEERRRRGIAPAEWQRLVGVLAERGYLKVNRAGASAVTNEGRNALGDRRFGVI